MSNRIYSEEELEEAMKMSIPELLESGKWVVLYDLNPSLKLYDHILDENEVRCSKLDEG